MIGEKGDIGDAMNLGWNGSREKKSLSRVLGSRRESSQNLEDLLSETLFKQTVCLVKYDPANTSEPLRQLVVLDVVQQSTGGGNEDVG